MTGATVFIMCQRLTNNWLNCCILRPTLKLFQNCKKKIGTPIPSFSCDPPVEFRRRFVNSTNSRGACATMCIIRRIVSIAHKIKVATYMLYYPVVMLKVTPPKYSSCHPSYHLPYCPSHCVACLARLSSFD